MDVRERIMFVRSSNNLSMQAFADTIGVSIGVIKNIEYGKAPATPVVCIAICSKFHIREEWLFHGDGEMMSSDDLVEQLCERRNLNAVQRRIVQAAADLGPDAAALLLALAEKIVSGVPAQEAIPTLHASDLPPYVPPTAQNEKKSG